MDIFTKQKRSEVMSAIKSKNTKPELLLRKILSTALYPRGYRYRINYRTVPGTPDVAFVKQKLAVFVDGGFWHGWKAEERKLPNAYWRNKIKKNMERDRRQNRELRKAGWRVLRFWDHALRKNPEKILKAVIEKISP